MGDLFSNLNATQPDDAVGRRVLTVGELNACVEAALQAAFPAAIWVRGEVQRLNHNRSGHIYFELHGADGSGIDQIRVAALKWDRDRFGLERYFDGSDPVLRIQDSMEICLQARLNYHPKWGLSLQLVGVDTTTTLGQLEARRRRTLAWLEQEGLLARNARIPLPDLPLNIGLITSAGSAAEADFLRTLHDSGYGFRVERADCRMMGERMVAQVVAAVSALGRSKVDVIVLTRGGGSKADLSWFDDVKICAAVAACPKPVVTAIGHEIDQSLTDLVAHHHCKTPTAAAADVVERVVAAEDRLERAATGTISAAGDVLDEARRSITVSARALSSNVTARVRGEAAALIRIRDGVSREVRRRLAAETANLDAGGPRLVASVRRRLAGERRELSGRAVRLAPERLLARWPRHRQEIANLTMRLERRCGAFTADRRRRLDHLAEKASLLDPARLLARGYSLTLDSDGRLVRSVAALGPGDMIRTRVHDGVIDSIVDHTIPEQTGGKE